MTEQKPFRVEVVVDAPRESVWRALTEPERVARWFGWDYGGLEGEINYIFVDHARREPPGLIVLDDGQDNQAIELVEEGPRTRVICVRQGSLESAVYLTGQAVPADVMDALGRELSGPIWHAGRFQRVVAAGGEGDLLAGIHAKLPIDSSEVGDVSLTVTTYGLDEGAFEALRQRWESWWAGLTRDVAA